MGRAGEHALRVAPHHMTRLAEIAGRILVDPGRAFRPRLEDIPHRLQFFIFHLHQCLCLREDIGRLRDHQTKCVSHIPCDIAFRDHHIPVLLNMTYLIAGYVLRGQHPEHAGKRKRPGGVDLQNPRPGVSGPDAGGVGHRRHRGTDRHKRADARVPFHVRIQKLRPASLRYKVLGSDIVRVLAIAKRLSPHIHTEGSPADADVLIRLEVLRLRLSAKDRGGPPDPLDDLLVPGAAAQIAAERGSDFLLRRIRAAVEQRLSCHHHPRNAEAALHRAA